MEEQPTREDFTSERLERFIRFTNRFNDGSEADIIRKTGILNTQISYFFDVLEKFDNDDNDINANTINNIKNKISDLADTIDFGINIVNNNNNDNNNNSNNNNNNK
jgi:hypothetical protein